MPAPARRADGADLRVLHVVASLDEEMGGSVQAALGQADERCRRGLPTEVVATSLPADSLGYLRADYPAVAWRTFPASFPRSQAASRAMGRWLRTEVGEVDVVHVHSCFHVAGLQAARAARGAGVPVVVQPHGSLDPFDLRKHAALKRVYGPLVVRRLLDAAGAVVCTTALEEEHLVTWGSSTPVRVVPLPVRPPPPADGAAFRQAHQIPADATVVLFLGRFDAKKGLDLLVAAVGRLRTDHPGVYLVVAGGGDQEQVAAAEALLAGPRAARWATAPGFLVGPDKAGAYAAADVFALPSRNENFGITIVEAAGAGVPLAISDAVALAPMVQERGAGAVGPVSVDGAVATISALLDPGRRSSAAAAARAMADEVFSPAAAGAAMEAVYADVAAGATMAR